MRCHGVAGAVGVSKGVEEGLQRTLEEVNKGLLHGKLAATTQHRVLQNVRHSGTVLGRGTERHTENLRKRVHNGVRARGKKAFFCVTTLLFSIEGQLTSVYICRPYLQIALRCLDYNSALLDSLHDGGTDDIFCSRCCTFIHFIMETPTEHDWDYAYTILDERMTNICLMKNLHV